MKAKKQVLGSMKKLALLTVFAGSTLSSAQTYTWTGGNGFWLDALNWGGFAPIGGFDTNLNFSGGGYQTTNNFAGELDLKSLSLFYGSWNLTGGTLGFASGGTLTDFGGDSIVSGHLILGADGLGGPLRVAAGGGDDASKLTLNGLVSGAGSLVFNGNVLKLGGTTANTYTGGSVLESGTIQMLHSGALGTGDMTFYGGTLDMQGHSQTVNNVNFGELTYGYTSGNILNGTMTVAGNLNAIGAADGSTPSIEFAGNLELTSGQHTLTMVNPLNSGPYANVILDNPISGAGGLTFDSAVAETLMVKLNGNSTYTGPTIINNAYVILGTDNALSTTTDVTVNPNGGLFLAYIADAHNQTIGGLNGGGFVEVGPDTLTLGNGGHSGLFTGAIVGDSVVKIGSGTETFQPVSLSLNSITAKEGTLKFGQPSVSGPALVMDGGTVDLNQSIAAFTEIYLGVGGTEPIGDIIDSTGAGLIGPNTSITYRGKGTAHIDANIATGATSINSIGLGANPYDVVIGGSLLGTAKFTVNGIYINDSNQFKVAFTGSMSPFQHLDVNSGTFNFDRQHQSDPLDFVDIGLNGTLDLAPSVSAEGVVAGNFDQSIAILNGFGKINLGTATLNISGNGATSAWDGFITGSGTLEASNNTYLNLAGNNDLAKVVENSAFLVLLSGTAIRPSTTLQIVDGMTVINAPTSVGNLIFGDGITPIGENHNSCINILAPLTLTGDITYEGTTDATGANNSQDVTIPHNLVLAPGQHKVGYVNHLANLLTSDPDSFDFGGISGSGDLIIQGALSTPDPTGDPFVVGFYGSNTNSGTTEAKAGTAIRTFNSNATSATSDLILDAGSTLRFEALSTQTVGSLSGGGSIYLNDGVLVATAKGESTTFTGNIYAAGTLGDSQSGLIVGKHNAGGQLTIQGGIQQLGSLSAIEGSLILTGTHTSVDTGLTIDDGSLLVNGGTKLNIAPAAPIYMGVKLPGSSITVSGAGTVFNDGGALYMRGAGQNVSLSVLNGGELDTASLQLVDNSSLRTVLVEGSGSILRASSLLAGNPGNSLNPYEHDITIDKGGTLVAGDAILGRNNSDTTYLTIDGLGSSATFDTIGSTAFTAGSLALHVSNGGTLNVNGQIRFSGDSVMQVSEGSNVSADSIDDSLSSTFSLDLTGGSSLSLADASVLNHTSLIDVIQSSLSTGLLEVQPQTVFELSDPTGGVALTLGMNNWGNDINATFDGADSVGGSIRKVGSGVSEITGSAQRFASLIVDGGSLRILNLSNLIPTKLRDASANGGSVLLLGGSKFNVTGNLNASENSVIEYTNGNRITGGTLTGIGSHLVIGSASFDGTTISHEATLTSLGQLSLTNVTVNGGLEGDLTMNGGRISSGAQLQVAGTTHLNGTEIDGSLSVTPTGTAIVDSPSLIVGAGGSILLGSEAQPGGTLQAGTGVIGATVELNGGTFMDNGIVNGLTVDVNNGGTLRGAGVYTAGYVLNAGGTVHPGNSPGILTSGSSTWNGGSNFLFEINDATGVVGNNWGENVIAGDLTINAGTNPSTKFNILLDSLDVNSGLSGTAAHFDLTQSYNWLFADVSGNLNGFDAATISLDASGFKNPYGTGAFSVIEQDLYGHHDLFVHYSAGAPTPEPSGFIAFGAGLGAFLIRRRRLVRGARRP